jgi:hypothetical protein
MGFSYELEKDFPLASVDLLWRSYRRRSVPRLDLYVTPFEDKGRHGRMIAIIRLDRRRPVCRWRFNGVVKPKQTRKDNSGMNDCGIY